jgi:hypothetical protein
LAVVAAPASASRPLRLGLFDTAYGSADPAQEAFVFDQTRAAGASIAKIPLNWRGVTGGMPDDPADPTDPAYDFSASDRAVRDAAARGIQPMLMVTDAPDFAEAPGRPPDAKPGSWKPSAAAYGDFATAVARRYSGSFATSAGTLPRVRYYQAWNEPNLSGYIAPQYEGDEAVAPSIFRDLLNSFYAAVKGVDPDAVVVTAGTAPYGDPPGAGRTHPVTFWRDVLCLDSAPGSSACPAPASFDVLAHHPINTGGSPRKGAIDPDDATTPDFGRLEKVLRAAEKTGRIATPGPHPLWATELWWETNPPDRLNGVPLRTQARWLEQSLFLFWKQHVSTVIYLSVRDSPYHPDNPLEISAEGLFFEDASPKPALTAFRFPFVATRGGDRSTQVWGRSPVRGRVRVQRRAHGRWEFLGAVRAPAGGVFRLRLGDVGGRRFRAVVGSERSLVWRRHPAPAVSGRAAPER